MQSFQSVPTRVSNVPRLPCPVNDLRTTPRQMNTPTRRKKRQTAAARGLQSRQSQTCLPGDLTDQLPSCAFACILDFTRQNYSPIDCTTTSNFDFLCTSQTRSGTTLGEASLQCVASNCADEATNNVLLAAYNICEDVDNALPNTATVINATIRPATPTASSTTPASPKPRVQSTSGTFTPASPSETGLMAGGGGSRVISGDGMSVTMDIMMPSTTGTSASTPSMTEMGSNFMPDEMQDPNPGLSTPAIAGIATGSGVAGLLLVALLFFLFRRRKQGKDDKAGWSKQVSSPDTEHSKGTSFGPARPKQFSPNKRRSFWRVSIKPEEIGVAVSGKAGNRKSTSSEKSMLGQTSTGIPDYMMSRSSWPAPFPPNLSAPPRPSRNSVSTIFDEDIEQHPNQPSQVSVGGTFFDLATPTKSSRPRPPEPLQLNQTRAVSPPLTSGASVSIPLTPTYDNGNFVATPNQTVAPNSIDAALSSTIPNATQGQVPFRFQDSPSPDTSPRRNRLQKKPSVRQPPPPAMTGPLRQDSTSTTFDTDTTPEEVEKRLELRGGGPLSTIVQSPRTPLTDLQYPSVPESAAVSSQARNKAQPRYKFRSTSSSILPLSIRPKRDPLFRQDSNATSTDSTYSDGRESDYSIEWPVPPSGRPPTNQAMPGTTAPISPLAKIENCATAESNYTQKRATEAQLSPNSQARITPTKSKTGDLFFKVEMQ